MSWGSNPPNSKLLNTIPLITFNPNPNTTIHMTLNFYLMHAASTTYDSQGKLTDSSRLICLAIISKLEKEKGARSPFLCNNTIEQFCTFFFYTGPMLDCGENLKKKRIIASK